MLHLRVLGKWPGATEGEVDRCGGAIEGRPPRQVPADMATEGDGH